MGNKGTLQNSSVFVINNRGRNALISWKPQTIKTQDEIAWIALPKKKFTGPCFTGEFHQNLKGELILIM